MGRIINLRYPFVKTTTRMGNSTNLFQSINDSSIGKGDIFKNTGGKYEVSDIDNVNKDRYYVSFIPMIIKDISNLTKTVATAGGNIAGSAIDSGKKGKGFIGGAIKELGKVLNELKTTAGEGLFDFTPEGFEKRLTSSITKDNSAIYISLPAKPIDLAISNSYQEDSAVQGNIGGDFDLISKQISQAFSGDISGALKTGQGSATAGIVQSAALNLALQGDKTGFLKTVMNQGGVSVYKPQRAFFTGTSPIGLKFDWVLSPKNRLEANTIKKIIQSFKILSVPSVATDNPGANLNNTSTFLQKNPAVWRIDYDNNEAINAGIKKLITKIPGVDKSKVDEFSEKVIPSFKDMIVKNNSFNLMVLTDVQVKYGDGEFWTTFPDGFPNVITLSLSFKRMFPGVGSELFADGGVNDLFYDMGLKSGSSKQNILGKFGF